MIGPNPPANELLRGEIRALLLDVECTAVRQHYSASMLTILATIDDWLAIDAWLGGGKISAAQNTAQVDDESFRAFRAVSMVLSMATELTEAAVTMVERSRYYAVGTVIRQLIECEYLLTLFSQDLVHARTWIDSSPAEIRAAFSPAIMRKRIGGFSNEEYWSHCDTGGHPGPKGARLLDKFDPAREVWPYAAAGLDVDLGQHLRRIWRATDQVLASHHARYTTVRARQREQAEKAWADWKDADPVLAILPHLEAVAHSSPSSGGC